LGEHKSQYLNISYNESRSARIEKHKPVFDEECLGLLEQRKDAKMQWVQDPSQSNVANINNVRRGAHSHFRNCRKISES
jgi:hypothetical protein